MIEEITIYNKYNVNWERLFHVITNIILQAIIKVVFLHRVSLIRPAPAELPQDRKVARVGSCSGAM